MSIGGLTQPFLDELYLWEEYVFKILIRTSLPTRNYKKKNYGIVGKQL